MVALFRRVPLPFISRHTAIIPRNKDRIGENLGQFVQEKFLDTQSLVALIRRHEPALLIGNWFSQPENAQRVGQHLLQIMSGFLELTDDARIQRLLKRAVHKAIDKVDLSGTSALMLESMTKNDRHQVLLDVSVTMSILLPGFITDAQVTSEIAVAETVIVGGVPNTYTYFSTTPDEVIDYADEYIMNNG